MVPGIKGLSDNINAVSIVDKYLEHTRVFVFANGGKPRYYLSSADWMIRNFDHRFEVAAPIYDSKLQKEMWDMLQIQLRDSVKARLINSTPVNQYRVIEGEEMIRSQFATYDYLKLKCKHE